MQPQSSTLDVIRALRKHPVQRMSSDDSSANAPGASSATAQLRKKSLPLPRPSQSSYLERLPDFAQPLYGTSPYTSVDQDDILPNSPGSSGAVTPVVDDQPSITASDVAVHPSEASMTGLEEEEVQDILVYPDTPDAVVSIA